jgi:hypothetical protein
MLHCSRRASAYQGRESRASYPATRLGSGIGDAQAFGN